MTHPLIYLASPYAHAEVAVREQRADEAARAAAHFMRQGHHLFAPIPHGHAIAKHGLPTEYAYWRDYCRNVLNRCDAIWVLTLPGWEESIGVTDEIDHMHRRGIRPQLITLDSIA